MPVKRFHFSLQKLLNLRGFEENKARVELGKAVSEVERINLSLRENAAKRVAAPQTAIVTKDGSSAARPLMDTNSLLALERYTARLDFERDRLLESLAAAEEVAQEKRGVYVEAAKKLKTLENLKDKKAAEWKRDALRAADDEIDDIVNSNGDI